MYAITNSKSFLDNNFLLHNDTAARLYHEFAKEMPIIDYHNHLPPNQISTNHKFENISQVWLYGDHYKWRAMRTMGVDESYITGQKSDKEKFLKWAEVVPYTLRNPLYHWTHLELQRYFDIHEILNNNTAENIYNTTSEILNHPSHHVQGLLSRMNVRVVCTTDEPTDNLSHHIGFAASRHSSLKMFPSFRPDKFIHIEQDNFTSSIEKLSEVTSSSIGTFDELVYNLKGRAQFFAQLGCKASDHGLEYISDASATREEIEKIFKKRSNHQPLSHTEIQQYKSALLYELSLIYHELGWVQQYHLGALRNNNSKAFDALGPDTGWDSIGDWSQAKNLSSFLNKLNETNQLAKTIIYNLNPADNEVMASMIGNFNDGSIKGKIQFGSGWWFLDQKDGIEKQINALSNMGLLSCFIGMLTDSRSFLSFPRHEYFRRILCNIFGREIEKGELPNDIKWTGKIIQDICYNNVKQFLNV
jgi:glucuronate isomerase